MTAYVVLLMIVGHFIVCFSYMTGLWCTSAGFGALYSLLFFHDSLCGTSADCGALYSLLFIHDRLMRYFSWLWCTLQCVILSCQAYEVLQMVVGNFTMCYSLMTGLWGTLVGCKALAMYVFICQSGWQSADCVRLSQSNGTVENNLT